VKRILVSPKALALATHLWTTYRSLPQSLTLPDAVVAGHLELSVDTVYRAYTELQGLGALSMDTRRQAGLRTVELHLEHWLFVALEQAAAEKAGV
jgi:hypothetical protein